jgi:protein SCO1/2
MQPRNLLIGLVLGIAIAAGLTLALRDSTGQAVPRAATILPAGNTLADFALLDQDGAPADKTVFEGQWDIVFFGFTHCPDICPATMTVLGQAKRQLAAQGQQPLPRVVLVSVDPERDTPEAMARYIAYFGDDNLGLTGELAEIRKLTDALGIFFEKAGGETAAYGVDHSTVVLVIDPRGRLKALFSAPHTVADLVHDLPLIMASGS